jgi:hypothetical protein
MPDKPFPPPVPMTTPPQKAAGSPEFLGKLQMAAKHMNWRQRGRRSRKQAPTKQAVQLYQIVLRALLEARKLRLAAA